MEYNNTIDEIMTQITFEHEKISSLKLKKATDDRIGRELSWDTFSLHLRKLITKRMLQKEDSGVRGTRIWYSLDANARMKQHLKVLTGPNKHRLLKLYQALLFYEHRMDDIQIRDHKVSGFLKRFGKKKNNLKITKKVRSPSVTLTYYEVSDAIDFWHARSDSESVYLNGYFFRILGFSKKGFLNRRRFTFDDIDFAPEETEQSFEALLQYGLIRQLSDYDGEPHFVISDERLRQMLGQIWLINQGKWLRYSQVWESRKPSPAEKTWLNKWLGEKNALESRDYYALKRREYQTRIHDKAYENTRKEYWNDLGIKLDLDIRELKEKYRDILQSYSFLHESIAIVCPEIMS